MCCDSPSDGALLLHEIMVAGPMELPVTPPSLCSRFDERACCQPSPGPSNLGCPTPPLVCTTMPRNQVLSDNFWRDRIRHELGPTIGTLNPQVGRRSARRTRHTAAADEPR